MGSVIERARLTRKKKVHIAIFAMYFAFAFAFVMIGLQPAKNSAAVYATEVETAATSLKIPEIGLEAPVKKVAISGTELEVPEQIAGEYSVHENKTLLIGHSSTIFADLWRLDIGAKFEYDGQSYKMIAKEERAKEDIVMKEILKAETVDTLVLMTCSGEAIPGTDGDHTHRLILTAVAE